MTATRQPQNLNSRPKRLYIYIYTSTSRASRWRKFQKKKETMRKMTDHCDVQIFFGFERSFCRCTAVMSCALGWCVCDLTCFQVMRLVVRWFAVLLWYYSVLQRTTTCYSSTTPTYYSVLQRTIPVLLGTTKYYCAKYYSILQSSTLYYKVLPQYYSALQITTPVLQSITPVLQSPTPVQLCTTKYYNVLLQYCSTTLY